MGKRGLTFVILWGAVLVYVSAVMMLRHTAPFQSTEQLAQGSRQLGAEVLNETSGANADKPHIAIHLLDERCSCSRAVIEDVESRSIADAVSVVLTTSEPKPETKSRLEAKGVIVRHLDPKEAKAQFGLETVPWFVVLDRQLNVLYSGGYSGTKIRNRGDILVDQVMGEIRQNRKPASLPTYGCVTSDKLRALLLDF